MTQIYNMSHNARAAFANGEKPRSDWSKTDIINGINTILEENGVTPPDNIGDLQKVTETVLREYMLKQKSWHHINGKPHWFHTLDPDFVCRLSRRDISRMVSETKKRERGRNKPKLAIVKKKWWIEVNGHETTKSFTKTGVVYNGAVYFKDGKMTVLRPDVCEVVKECGPIVKENRKLFEEIVKHMRASYGIAI